MIWLVIILVCLLIELIYWIGRLASAKKRKQKRAKALHRLMERRVLERTLRERIGRDKAYYEEMNKPFLCVEFPETKPLLSYMYSLDDCVTIGRSSENMICIRDNRVSRLHAKIMNTQGGLVIQDMGTANGTRVRRGLIGRTRIEPGRKAQIKSGDTAIMGNYRMKVRVCYGWEAHR